MTIYYIGGSPCAGKSIVAEELSRRYGLFYFKVDDYLDIYTITGAAKDRSAFDTDSSEGENFRICRKQLEWSAEQIWMRNLEIQCQEELMAMEQIPESRYLSITPTKEFQLFHFRKREFVPYILRD